MRACVPSLLKVANPYPYPYPTPNPTPNPLPKAAFRALGWGGRFLVVGFASGGAAPKAAIPRLPLNLALLNERRVAQHVVSPACRLGGAATHLPGLLGLTTVCRYPAARRSRDAPPRRSGPRAGGVQEECRRSAGGGQEECRRSAGGVQEAAVRPCGPAEDADADAPSYDTRCLVSSGAHGRRASVTLTAPTLRRCSA